MEDDEGQRRKKRKMNSEDFDITQVMKVNDAFLEQKIEGREALRHRTEQDETRLIERLSRLLREKLTGELGELDPQTVEVEIRVGIAGQTFLPGMKEVDFQSLMALLKTPTFKSDFEVTYSDTIDFFYTLQENKFRLSCTVGDATTAFTSPLSGCPPLAECTSAIAKEKHFKEDIKGIANRWIPLYDLRFSINTETVYGAPAIDSESFPWDHIEEWRRKKRTSFSPLEKSQHWRVDMTEAEPVVVLKATPGSLPPPTEKLFEVEFELKPESIVALYSEEDEAKHKEMRMHICRDFIRMANLIFDKGQAVHAATPLIQGVRTTRVTEPSLLFTLRTECLNAVLPNPFEGYDPMKFGFPGSMPVSLSRSHIEMVQNAPYLVSEKADGVRYFFVIFQGACYLVDRKFDFFEVHGFEGLCEFYRQRTILDGEIVTDLTTHRPKYIVFDMVELNGDNCTKEFANKRFERIGTFVRTFRELAPHNPNFPFDMIGKMFRPKEHILSLFEKIRGSIFQNDDRRHYVCDGILLTPMNQPYRPKGNLDLLKWKFLEKQTVDFYVEILRNDTIQLSCEGDGESRAMCRKISNLDGANRELIETVRQRSRDPGSSSSRVVAEFAFDVRDGSWKFHMIRKDKNKANHTSVAFDTMEAIAQNITKEELMYRLSRPKQSDDWEERQKFLTANMMKSLVSSSAGSEQQKVHHSSSQPHPTHPPSSSSNSSQYNSQSHNPR